MALKKKKAEDRLKQDLKLEKGGDDGGERGGTRKLEVAVEPMKAGRKIKLTNVNP